MKKVLLISLLCLCICGCGKKEEKVTETKYEDNSIPISEINDNFDFSNTHLFCSKTEYLNSKYNDSVLHYSSIYRIDLDSNGNATEITLSSITYNNGEVKFGEDENINVEEAIMINSYKKAIENFKSINYSCSLYKN